MSKFNPNNLNYWMTMVRDAEGYEIPLFYHEFAKLSSKTRIPLSILEQIPFDETGWFFKSQQSNLTRGTEAFVWFLAQYPFDVEKHDKILKKLIHDHRVLQRRQDVNVSYRTALSFLMIFYIDSSDPSYLSDNFKKIFPYLEKIPFDETGFTAKLPMSCRVAPNIVIDRPIIFDYLLFHPGFDDLGKIFKIADRHQLKIIYERMNFLDSLGAIAPDRMKKLKESYGHLCFLNHHKNKKRTKRFDL